MDTFITSAGMLALVKAVVDLLKYVRAKDTNGYVTQLVVWAAGVGGTWLLAHSDFGNVINVGGVSLASANFVTQVLAGLGLGSAAMLTTDFKQAIDHTDTAIKPPLVDQAPRSNL